MIINPTATEAVEQNTISALENLSVDIPVPVAEIDTVAKMLWEKYKNEIRNKTDRQEENKEVPYTYPIKGGDHTTNVRTISQNGRTMRFTVEKKGAKPENGYPVFIALHGGGGCPTEDNNGLWKDMQTIWSGDVNPGIYIAVRGITDTWNLHFQPESFSMYDRLIENAIAFEDADPNAIYLMGFSAGGDGVYDITAKMADRFGATNMMAGHPNSISIDNYANVPFLIQMGEKDTEYNRHLEAARYDALLTSAAKSKGYGYIHETFIHPNGSHNSWQEKTYISWSQPNDVIDDIAAWLAANGSGGAIVKKNTASVTWMLQHKRNPYPKRVIWNTKVLAPQRKIKQFYWLNAGTMLDGSTLDVELEEGSNSINIRESGNYVGILLNSKMVDFNKPVNIIKNGEGVGVQVTPSLKKMVQTLVHRGDPNYIFPAEIIWENINGELNISV
ncbi:hypothetical protein F7734_15675 [Scytonema sp. UIC 10036]|uniref:hypothetical protein n=1 Tax=Scytonema sp. UIC 10036 TaxID=2304196 RepID=UPI0012DA3A28|nr:hypothetical protein [Scytonema sp. UIC 10036]MUG93776.1 hypothetical protein [Scytonema sp. UIC 10036]